MNRNLPPTPPSVLAQISQLNTLTMAELRQLWQTLTHDPLPAKRVLIERHVAYRLQVQALEATGSTLVKQNQQRIQALIEQTEREEKKKKRNAAADLLPGTVLSRDFQGKTYRVTVTHDKQFDLDGHAFASLSAVARHITGTRWSGLRFFGLDKRSV
jgi:hypothetical protein